VSNSISSRENAKADPIPLRSWLAESRSPVVSAGNRGSPALHTGLRELAVPEALRSGSRNVHQARKWPLLIDHRIDNPECGSTANSVASGGVFGTRGVRLISLRVTSRLRGSPKSPTRQQGSLSKPDAQAREYFKSPPRKQGSISKARRASKGLFAPQEKATLAGAAGFEDVALRDSLAGASGFMSSFSDSLYPLTTLQENPRLDAQNATECL
jgi:hypothetical protein